MYTCTTCFRTYSNEPFRRHGKDGFYCFIDCLSIRTLDEYKALSYSELLQYYFELTEEPFASKTPKERGELLFEVNELQDFVTPNLMEDRGNFYCEELQNLYDNMNALRGKWEII